MSDEEKEVDAESEEENTPESGLSTEDGKRAHHNALERKRRDHIKDSFTGLKESIPTLQGDKTSRAQILKKASEYIAFMRKKNSTHANDIDDLRRQNQHLENQIKLLEKAKSTGQYDMIKTIDIDDGDDDKGGGSERKKMKTN
eukprot:TRINITY_DN19801_c0_g1_i1.p1 TRINITY_DN19801_c0_g1~~TRINITY_DN19801_c0_g1_i1.p1  ORF type:complete len:143 (+),score=31.36 TRINITY_DN19801_c0_g1_i1:33-461(+)